MSEKLQDLAPLPLDERISNELIKHNVTEAIISKLREDYLPLKIAGIEDKETYLLVKDARKKCKEIRVLAKKICVEGREDAVAIQKAWVAKEKEVTSKIGEVEDYLEKQEKEYEAAVAKEKEDRKRRQEEQLIMRQQLLTSMGALYSDGSFHLGDVSFELSVVKESEPDIWEESILPKFKEEYEKVEAERIEKDRLKREQEAEMKRQQDELERKQKELADKEAALKKAQEEQERRRIEDEDKKKIAENARIEKLLRSRVGMLKKINWDGSMAFSYERGGVVVATYEQLVHMDDDTFDIVMNEHNNAIDHIENELEQKRLAEIEAQKEAERKMVLGQSRLKALKELGRVPADATDISLSDLSEEEYDTLYANEKREYEAAKRAMWEKEQEEKRKQDELKKQLELEQAKDKEKWEEIIRRVNEIEVYEMRSSRYRKKAMILREKLEEIKAL